MTTPRKKIAYVSGTRADFGLMTPVLQAIEKSDKLSLQVYATGMHLMPEFGNTLREVLKEFPTAKQISVVFRGDERKGMAEFAGAFLSKAIAVFEWDKPDFILTLGDRPEMLMVASACLYLGIPTGHVHGGEKTSTVDEVARHAITKLASLHFPATEESAERIKKMGEEEWRVHIVGAPALDTILHQTIPSRDELLLDLGMDTKKEFILVTQHPVSEEWEVAWKQMEEIIAAVKTFNLPVVAVYPHADAGGRSIINVLEKEKNNPLFKIFPSIEYKKFLALERETAVWVGNSSGALIESSSFGTPVVNVGMRQYGRARVENVIDVGYFREEIQKAMEKSLHDKKYRVALKKIKNPWGDGRTGPRVVKILEDLEFGLELLSKRLTY